jgi:hypothetical protein
VRPALGRAVVEGQELRGLLSWGYGYCGYVYLALHGAAARDVLVGAENLRHQAIFVNHAPGAIAPLDPELIQTRDGVGQLP